MKQETILFHLFSLLVITVSDLCSCRIQQSNQDYDILCICTEASPARPGLTHRPQSPDTDMVLEGDRSWEKPVAPSL